jgi:hypothetical protein
LRARDIQWLFAEDTLKISALYLVDIWINHINGALSLIILDVTTRSFDQHFFDRAPILVFLDLLNGVMKRCPPFDVLLVQAFSPSQEIVDSLSSSLVTGPVQWRLSF